MVSAVKQINNELKYGSQQVMNNNDDIASNVRIRNSLDHGAGATNSPTIITPLRALILISVLLIVFSYWAAVSDMVVRWGNMEEYGYAYFIPFITVYLLWNRRQRLEVSGYRPSWVGVVGILIAGCLFFLGTVATTFTLVQYALVLTIMSFAYALLGFQSFKLVFGPLFLLFFVVPLPPFIFNNLSGKLQLLSSELGVDVIRFFGISVYLEGNVIDLGEYKLQVVEACSGLRYLFPLVSLAYLAAYLFRVELWKRIAVFLSSIPITVLMNSFRIGVIGVLVDNWGSEQADGFLHYFEGWVVFMACLLILILEMTVLVRIGKRAVSLRDVFGLENPSALPNVVRLREKNIRPAHYGVVAAVVLIAISSIYGGSQQEMNPDRSDFSGFPTLINGWRGNSDILEDVYLKSLKLDDYLIGDYYKNGSQVNFYAAYYASQRAGSAAHSPRSCIPGGGWEIDKVTQVDVPSLKVNGHTLTVNRLVIKKGDVRQLVYYWFQQRGRVITNEWMVKWYLFYDGLTRQRTDGALVRLTTSVELNEDWSDGDRRLVDFAETVVPELDQYIPN